MINIKNFDSNLLKIDKKSNKNIGIYYIGYITIQKIGENIYCVSPLYLTVKTADGHIENKNGNKYLTSVCTDENEKVLKKYTELWHEIKYLIKTINGGKEGEYNKSFMKIKIQFRWWVAVK